MQPKIKNRQLSVYLLIFVVAPTLTFLIGRQIDKTLGLPILPHFPLNLFIGMLVMIIGLNLGIKSTRHLYHAGYGLPWGEAVPEVESSKLIVDGIYKYSRNPMVLGYSLLPVGMGIMFQSIGMMVSITLPVLLINFIILKTREEPRLLERFGDEYDKYRKQTPFLFPNWIDLVEYFIIPYIKTHRDLLIYVIVAETSLIISTVLITKDPFPASYSYQSILDIIFLVICVLGILAGISPKSYNLRISSERRDIDSTLGHHPDCGNFKNHILNVGEKVYCAGCSGLVLGAIFALLGLFTQFYPLNDLVGFWFGALIVSLGLAQHLIDLGSGWVHFWLNFGFVTGVWFMFESIKSMGISFYVSIYFLAVTVFWIFARIRSSQWVHVSICNECDEKCFDRFE